jgi:hypothetical protein
MAPGSGVQGHIFGSSFISFCASEDSPCVQPSLFVTDVVQAISVILNAKWVQDGSVQVWSGVQRKVSDGFNGHFESELTSTLKKRSLIQQAQQFGTKCSRGHLNSVMYRMSVSVKTVPCGHRSPHFYYCLVTLVEQGLDANAMADLLYYLCNSLRHDPG